MAELKSRKFELRDATVLGIEDDGRIVIWMVEEFEALSDLEVARRSTPLASIYTHEHVNGKALAEGLLSMLNNFGMPDGTKRFVEHKEEAAYETDSITGR